MKRVHFLANRDQIVNYTLAPVRYNIAQLHERGYEIKVFYKLTDACLDCDILCLISKPTYKLVNEKEAIFKEGGPIIELLRRARSYASKIIWMDDSDSSTVTHFEVLPYVDLYMKKQILKNRELYRQSFYGGRIFTEFYHQNFGVEDDNPFMQFYPLLEGAEKKVCVSWNIGLGDMFSAFALKNFVQRFFPDLALVNYDVNFVNPKHDRPVDVFLRTSVDLTRNTVAFHRKEMLNQLDRYLSEHSDWSGMIGNNLYQAEGGHVNCLPVEGGKLPMKVYRKIMSETKVVPSPFGWGELGVRDYEAFIFGGMLLKPDVGHMETWPDIFIPGETYQPISWGFGDMEGIISDVINDPIKRLQIAHNGQDIYRESISKRGMEKFCDWFTKKIES